MATRLEMTFETPGSPTEYRRTARLLVEPTSDGIRLALSERLYGAGMRRASLEIRDIHLIEALRDELDIHLDRLRGAAS